jgi:hypothetical protein
LKEGRGFRKKKVRHRGTEKRRRRREKEKNRIKGVIPAKAGIHLADIGLVDRWIPAFAGMTTFE